MALNLRATMQVTMVMVMVMVMVSAPLAWAVKPTASAQAEAQALLPEALQCPPRATQYDMTVYVHVNMTEGPDKGEANVAGLNGTNSEGSRFGTIIVWDGLITEGSTPNTTSVGRLQGIYANAAIAGNNFFLSVSFIFHDRNFNGSTIQILGSDRQDIPVRAVSVVGGTGVFSFATGTADVSLLYINITSLYTLKFHLKFYTLHF